MKKHQITFELWFNKNLKKSDCLKEMIYLIGVKPFYQKGYLLKNNNKITNFIQPGQYRISLQYFSKEYNINVNAFNDTTSVKDTLTYDKFLYFELTEDNKIIPGNKLEFDKLFKIRKINYNKEKIKFWNTYWKILHTMTYYYPNNPSQYNKNDLLKLIKFMKTGGLPCEICTKHFNQYTQKNNINYSINSRNSLFKYFVDLHNDVNIRNRKKTISYKQALSIYKNTHDEIKKKFYVDLKNLIQNNSINKIPFLMNGSIRKILMKDFNLL